MRIVLLTSLTSPSLLRKAIYVLGCVNGLRKQHSDVKLFRRQKRLTTNINPPLLPDLFTPRQLVVNFSRHIYVVVTERPSLTLALFASQNFPLLTSNNIMYYYVKIKQVQIVERSRICDRSKELTSFY